MPKTTVFHKIESTDGRLALRSQQGDRLDRLLHHWYKIDDINNSEQKYHIRYIIQLTRIIQLTKIKTRIVRNPSNWKRKLIKHDYGGIFNLLSMEIFHLLMIWAISMRLTFLPLIAVIILVGGFTLPKFVHWEDFI